MEEKNKDNIIKGLSSIEGEVRGVTLKTDGEYILKEKGKEELKKVEKKLQEWGFKIEYDKINNMIFYPAPLRIASLLAIKEVFGFDDEKMKEMGVYATKISLIIKLFLKFFVSIERVFYKESIRIWGKHYTFGKLIPVELNEEKKYAIIRVEDFNLHPIYCYYLGGYFSGILQMLIKTPKINSEETKCYFRGQNCHEFLIKWQ